MEGTAAIVLAGGAARRLGGQDKPALAVAGVAMLDRVLDALAGAVPIVVVGPTPGRDLRGRVQELGMLRGGGASTVRRVQEQPPGGGPAAAIGAGLDALVQRPGPSMAEVLSTTDPGLVFVLAGDLPLFTARAAVRLRTALRDGERAASPIEAAHGVPWDGAIYADTEGKPQWLCGIWRISALQARVCALAQERAELVGRVGLAGLAGASMRALFGPMRYATITPGVDEPPPYWDCDTDEDIREAERWLGR